MKLKTIRNSKGFTIVELLIVIIIIGILAALVLNSFRGVQERARDTERQTDINAQQSQLEVYYTDNGEYPTLANVQDDNWISGNLKGADLNAWRAPNQTTNSETGTATPTIAQYGYVVTNDAGTSCDNTTGNECVHYKLYYKTENNPTTKEKDSLN